MEVCIAKQGSFVRNSKDFTKKCLHKFNIKTPKNYQFDCKGHPTYIPMLRGHDFHFDRQRGNNITLTRNFRSCLLA